MNADHSKLVLIRLPVEFGIPITIVKDGNHVWVSGAEVVSAEFPAISSEEEVGGFKFANILPDLGKANVKVTVVASRVLSGSRTLVIGVGAESGKTFSDIPRLDVKGDKEGLHIKAFKPDSLNKRPVHLADIPIKVDKSVKK